MVVANGQLSENSEKAIAVYKAEIESQLSEDDDGRYIVIDAETGEWDIGDTQDLILEFWDRDPLSESGDASAPEYICEAVESSVGFDLRKSAKAGYRTGGCGRLGGWGC